MSEQSNQMNSWKIDGPKALPEKLPPHAVWPAMLSFGVALLAFGILTSPYMYIAGLIFLIISTAGWIEDLRNDQL
jgi:hypothetical protein